MGSNDPGRTAIRFRQRSGTGRKWSHCRTSRSPQPAPAPAFPGVPAGTSSVSARPSSRPSATSAGFHSGVDAVDRFAQRGEASRNRDAQPLALPLDGAEHRRRVNRSPPDRSPARRSTRSSGSLALLSEACRRKRRRRRAGRWRRSCRTVVSSSFIGRQSPAVSADRPAEREIVDQASSWDRGDPAVCGSRPYTAPWCALRRPLGAHGLVRSPRGSGAPLVDLVRRVEVGGHQDLPRVQGRPPGRSSAFRLSCR